MLQNELGKKIRLIALWIMLITLISGNILLWVFQQFVWAIFLTIILLMVAVFEIYGIFFSPQKTTISNMWKQWAEKSPIWAYTTLTLLWVGLNALVVHLAFF